MALGENIKKARKNKGLKQVELAEIVGISVNSVRLYESDKVKPKLATIQCIAHALGVCLDDLLGGIETFDSGEEFDNRRKELLEKAGDESLTVIHTTDPRKIIESALNQLNDEGQLKAAERVSELTEIPRYRKDAAQDDLPPQGEG